jgi:hypothetical protein
LLTKELKNNSSTTSFVVHHLPNSCESQSFLCF